MKAFRKMFAILMTLAIVLSLATVAFADGGNHTITINFAGKGHTYTAYQVFAGKYEKVGDDEILSNITWGNGVKSDELLAALQADTTIGSVFESCTNAAEVAEATKNLTTAETAAFADVIGANLGTAAGASSGSTQSGDEYVYTIAGLDDGYYFVKDTGTVEGNDAATKFILQVVGDVTVNAKASVPSVKKEIVDGASSLKANTAEIGKVVRYKITGTMPSTIGDYKTYYYEFHDTLSKGLTYMGNLSIKIEDEDVTNEFTKTIGTYGATTGTDISLKINDIKSIPDVTITAGTEVVVTYDAIVNENAVVGTKGNPNDVELKYSNNPNYNGIPGDEDEPHGVTPKDTVITYTTKVVLTKVDGANTTQKLTGAKFGISGTSGKVRIINEQMFVKKTFNADSTETKYYRLKDGKYSVEAPTEATMDKYDGTDTYALVEHITTDTVDEDFEAEGWVKSDGTLTITGLGEGTYTITELVAPAGYNLLKDSITVVISSDVNNIANVSATSTVTWTAKDGSAANAKDYTVTSDGYVTLNVENNKGATLPETGGMGTTLIYIVGSLMVVGAGVLLITKKRMEG